MNSEVSGPQAHNRPTTTTAVVRFDNVSMHRAGQQAPKFSNLSFMLTPSSCVVLTGALDCGKSGALRMIVGMEQPSGGRVTVHEQHVAGLGEVELDALRQRIGFMPETGALLSNLNLFENMVLPYRYHTRTSEEQVQQRAAETLELLQMAPLPPIIPPNASRGLCRQVALARALILRPSLLVLDSPVSDMDHNAARDLWRTLNRLMTQIPLSMVVACEFPPHQDNLKHRLVQLNKEQVQWQA